MSPLVEKCAREGDEGERTCPYPTLPLSNPPFSPKVADDIIASQVEAIVVSIESVAVKLGLGAEPFPVRRPLFFLALTTTCSVLTYAIPLQLVLAGGVLTHSGSYVTEKLQKRLAEKLPRAEVVLPKLSAEEAAAYLIMKSVGQEKS